jgi:hypothetical protein
VLPYTNKIWPDENGGFFYALVGEMLKQGLTPDEIGKIGGGNLGPGFRPVTMVPRSTNNYENPQTRCGAGFQGYPLGRP